MKNIKQKIFKFIFLTIFFVCPYFSKAEVIINEIQVSPIENRFLEIFNNGDSDVNLTGWYLQRKTPNSESFSSMVSSTNFEGKIIKAGDYFVISKSSSVASSIVFDKLTITESNQIVLKNNNQQIVDLVSFEGFPNCNSCLPNPQESKSVSLIGNSWKTTNPTPLSENSNTKEEFNTTTSQNSSGSSSSTSSSSFVDATSKKKIILNPNIVSKIEAPSVVVAGIPFEIKQKTIGLKNEVINFGKFVWNFGDGNQKELVYGGPFFYKYENSGDYVLSLSYYDTRLTTSRDSFDRKNIKVVPSGVKILSVGSGDSPFVEIKNETGYEVELNNWIIKGFTKDFIIPSGTILLSGKTIKISSSVTGFTKEDVQSIQLVDTSGTVFDIFPESSTSNKTATNYVKKLSRSDSSIQKNEEQIKETKEEKEIFNLNDHVQNLKTNKGNQNIVSYLIFVLIVGLGIWSIYSFSKKNDSEKEDFDSSDIKIME